MSGGNNIKRRRPRNPWTPEKIFKIIISTIRNYNGGTGCTIREIFAYLRTTQDIALDDDELMTIVKLSVKKGINLDFLRRHNNNGKYYMARLSSDKCKRQLAAYKSKCSPKEKLQLQSSCQQSKVKPYPMPKRSQVIPSTATSFARDSVNMLRYRQAKTIPKRYSDLNATSSRNASKSTKPASGNTSKSTKMSSGNASKSTKMSSGNTSKSMKTTSGSKQSITKRTLPNDVFRTVPPSNIKRPMARKIIGLNKIKVATKGTSTRKGPCNPKLKSKSTSTNTASARGMASKSTSIQTKCLGTSTSKTTRSNYNCGQDSSIKWDPPSDHSLMSSDSLSRGSSISSIRETPCWFMHRKRLQILSADSSERVVNQFKDHLKRVFKF